ncbi:hypothetical protein CRG98_017620 [Punica granatum]|uniref:Uncharacterized protein n=1 Tax=Punica granatum TaxID=22663 RepID=A0A2I0K097_PUNGR|nr:hypothetical protein CRG98_017620 [Punica granatum]
MAPRVHPGLLVSVQVHPGPSGLSRLLISYSGPPWFLLFSFGSIPVSFGSIPVLISSAMSRHVQARYKQQWGGDGIRTVAGPKRGMLIMKRIPDQSPGYYSSPGNRRRMCGHGVMNNRRRAGSARKAEESGQKNRQDKEPQKQWSRHCGTIHHRITEAPKGLPGPAPPTSKRHSKTGLQAPKDHRGRGTRFRRPFGTLQGSPRDVSVVANASR